MKKIVDKKFTLKDGTDIFLEINIDKRNNNGYAAVTVPGCDGVTVCRNAIKYRSACQKKKTPPGTLRTFRTAKAETQQKYTALCLLYHKLTSCKQYFYRLEKK